MEFFILEPLKNVYILGSFTILFSHILDFTIDKETFTDYLQKKTDLYIQGLISLYMNLLLVSSINYIIAYNYLLDINTNQFQIIKYSGVLFIHNIMYFIMHSMVHKIESIRFIHKFHHLFVKNIPSIGNSVSFLEFQIMYVLPFLTSMFLLEPNVKTINVGIFTISFLNSLIHSTYLKKCNWLYFLVSPEQHCKHHEIYTGNYAAPLLNLDLLISSEKKTE